MNQVKWGVSDLKEKPNGDIACNIYQAWFSAFGEIITRSTGCRDRKMANAKAEKMAKAQSMLLELKAKAIKNGRIPPEAEPLVDPEFELPNPKDLSDLAEKPFQPRKLDLTKEPTSGSLWAAAKAQLERAEKRERSESTKEKARRAYKDLCDTFGVFLDLPISKFHFNQGLILAWSFNRNTKIQRSGPQYAKQVRILLEPLVKEGLDPEFIEALKLVERQTESDDKSDPFLAVHFKMMLEQLATGQEEDFLWGLFLIGCTAGPQITDPALLLWKGVNFETREVLLYRKKTEILARFKMSPRLRVYLLKRKAAAGPNALYVFPELVFGKREFERDDFIEKPVTNKKRLKSISTSTSKEWREFLHRAGIPVRISTFLPRDIQDLQRLVTRLRERADPVCFWLWDQFGPWLQNALAIGTIDEDLPEKITNSLNEIVGGNVIFDPTRFAEFTGKLRPTTRELLKTKDKLEKDERVRLNRMLLEDVFQCEIRKLPHSDLHYSYSSFRKHFIAFVRSIGFRVEVLMEAVGHKDWASIMHYMTVAEHERNRLERIVTRHNEAMFAGQDEFYPTTPLDLLDAIEPRLATALSGLDKCLKQLEVIVQMQEETKREMLASEERIKAAHRTENAELKAMVHGLTQTVEVLAQRLDEVLLRKQIDTTQHGQTALAVIQDYFASNDLRSNGTGPGSGSATIVSIDFNSECFDGFSI